MTKQKIYGIAVGEKLYRKMVDAWLEAALVSFQLDGDKEATKEFRVAFGRDPKQIIRAVERFPSTFSPDTSPDLFAILAAIHLSRVESDEDAAILFDTFKMHKDYDRLKMAVKASVPHRERKTAVDAHARIKAGITAWMMESNYNLLDSEVDDLAVQIKTALESDARRGARKEAQ
ncbi:MAG: hypothetical protein A2W25_15510 [candidate division Zixibacteria bacterium RBG_16_53_22]|nr:MAG: hypothetical protein A2W25_15510 [candidate division Zixibacteria bacterium RBG_16_53_22]